MLETMAVEIFDHCSSKVFGKMILEIFPEKRVARAKNKEKRTKLYLFIMDLQFNINDN